MLVLTRKQGERILIKESGIVIQVVRVNGSTVRLGISAPEGQTIVREEITDIPPRR